MAISDNTTGLQEILAAVNSLPEAGGGGGDCSCVPEDFFTGERSDTITINSDKYYNADGEANLELLMADFPVHIEFEEGIYLFKISDKPCNIEDFTGDIIIGVQGETIVIPKDEITYDQIADGIYLFCDMFVTSNHALAGVIPQKGLYAILNAIPISSITINGYNGFGNVKVNPIYVNDESSGFFDVYSINASDINVNYMYWSVIDAVNDSDRINRSGINDALMGDKQIRIILVDKTTSNIGGYVFPNITLFDALSARLLVGSVTDGIVFATYDDYNA